VRAQLKAWLHKEGLEKGKTHEDIDYYAGF
jgi:hypothetical protein